MGAFERTNHLGRSAKNSADRPEVLGLRGVLLADGSFPKDAGASPPPVLRRSPGVVGASLVLPASRAALACSHSDAGQGLRVEGAAESPVLPPIDLSDGRGDEQQRQDKDALHGGGRDVLRQNS